MQEDEGKPRPVAYDGREAHDAELIYPVHEESYWPQQISHQISMTVDETQDQSPPFAGSPGAWITLPQCCRHSAAPLPAAADSAIRPVDLPQETWTSNKSQFRQWGCGGCLAAGTEGRRHQWVFHFDDGRVSTHPNRGKANKTT